MGNRVTLWASHPFLEWPGHRDGCEMEGLRKEPGRRMQADAYPGSILTTPVALAQPLPWPDCQVINPRKGTEHLLHPDEWETQISSAHFHPSRSSPGGSVSSNHSQHLSVHFIYLSYPWSHSTICEGGVESWDQIQALSFTDCGFWVSYSLTTALWDFQWVDQKLGLYDSKSKALSKKTSSPRRKENLSGVSCLLPSEIPTNQTQPSATGRRVKLSNPLKFHEEKTHRRRGIVPPLWDSIPSSGQYRLTTGRLQPSGIQPLLGVQMLTGNSRGWESGEWGWADPCATEEGSSRTPTGWGTCTKPTEMWKPAVLRYSCLFAITGSSQCDFWWPAAGQHSASLYFKWTFWLVLLGLQKLEPHFALPVGRVWREAVCYLFIHSFTLLGTRGPALTRQIKAPAPLGLVEWLKIWGRSTGALFLGLAFTVRMISSILKLSELSSLRCQVCTMMPPSYDLMSGRIYSNKCECFANYKDHIDFSYYG